MGSVGKIIDKLMIWETGQDFKIQLLSAQLPPELQPILDRTYLRDLSLIEDQVREWDKTLREVKEMYIKAELKKLAEEIAMAEKKGEVTEELQARFVNLSRSLSGIM